MKFRIKPLIAAVALIGVLPAHAAMDDGFFAEGSSLFLFKYDAATEISATFDLGLNYSDFSINNTSTFANNSSPTSRSWDLTKDDYATSWQRFTELAATEGAANVLWGVMAVDNEGTGAGSKGIIQTFNQSSSTPSNLSTFETSQQIAAVNALIVASNFPGDKVVTTHQTAPNGAAVANENSDSVAKTDELMVSDNVNGVGGTAVAAYGENLVIKERLVGTSRTPSTVALLEAENGELATFSLSANGQLVLNVPGTTDNSGGSSDNGSNNNSGGSPDNSGGSNNNSGGSPDNSGGSNNNSGGSSDNGSNNNSGGSAPNVSMQSLFRNAHALRGIFNMQSAVINTGLTYDCTTFDQNGICVSAGGRATSANNPSTNSQAALLIAAYQATPNWRLGGYFDQSLNTREPSGVNFDNNKPMGGLFTVWNQNTDGTGYQLRFAAGYGSNDITIKRNLGLNADVARGDASLQAQAYSGTVSYGMKIDDSSWIASPYLGMRYTKVKRSSYTEDISNPLSYGTLSQDTKTAMMGLRFNGQVGENVFMHLSAGVERDLSNDTSDYEVRNGNNVGAFEFNQNVRRTRPVAQAGLNYAIDKSQSLGVQVNYRQEAFNSSNSVTGLFNYQIGF